MSEAAGAARNGAPSLADERPVRDGQLALLGPEGDSVSLVASANGGPPLEALVLAGEPLREPVALYGPFVMTTEGEIRQALLDYPAGRLGRIEGWAALAAQRGRARARVARRRAPDRSAPSAAVGRAPLPGGPPTTTDGRLRWRPPADGMLRWHSA